MEVGLSATELSVLLAVFTILTVCQERIMIQICTVYVRINHASTMIATGSYIHTSTCEKYSTQN